MAGKKFSLIEVILSVICVVFTIEAAAPASAMGNVQFFWWIFLIITFFASLWSGGGRAGYGV